jgi:hypothetical protein
VSFAPCFCFSCFLYIVYGSFPLTGERDVLSVGRKTG